MSKIVLVDGHSILNRAFYGMPDLTNAEGTHTGAVYGFLNILFRILEEEKPEYLAVAFDVHAPTFRHRIFEGYKGTRKPMPEELREQVPLIKDVLKAMDVLIMEQAGLEADDLLGTMAYQSEKLGVNVSLVSGDRDLLQVATDQICIRIPKTKAGKTEIENYYAEDVKAVYGVTPTQFIELKALMGDTADNIPGVPKIGEKTATALLTEYETIDNLYAHLDLITKKSVHDTLEANRDLADLSKTLATIKLDCDIPFSLEKAEIGILYTDEAYEWFRKLEFKNFLGRFEQKDRSGGTEMEGFRTIDDFGEVGNYFRTLLEEISGAQQPVTIGFAVMEDAGHTNFIGIALCKEKEACFLPAIGLQTKGYLIDSVCKLAEQPNCRISTFDAKSMYFYLNADGQEDHTFDILIASYLLDPLRNGYDPAYIGSLYLNLQAPDLGTMLGKSSLSDYYADHSEEIAKVACYHAYIAANAVPVLTDKLSHAGMLGLFYEIEMPLTRVLYEMQREGIRVRPEALKEYSEMLGEKIAELESKIYETVGENFNINSPKQLGEILFEKLQIPGGKKTKTGYSTAADVLEKLAPDFPVISDILEYRGLTKLKGTYADGLTPFIDEDNRIRSTFHQTITATGRISSADPNLQNIPMRTELGRAIRKVFIPKDGFLFTDADYSQIELRILAHMSGDEQLIRAYGSHQDIHRTTASQVFHVPFEEVTDLQRRNAKAVNFGIVYGISSFGLSQDLSISKKEAQQYIDQYFAVYPGIHSFLDGLVQKGKEDGFVTTMFGRIRPIPELASSNFMQRSFGERIAMNSPVQGTAADIMKNAMIRVYRRLRDEGLASRLILQIHDELLIETALDEQEQVKRILEEEMEGAADLAVKLEIDLHTGNDWYEAK